MRTTFHDPFLTIRRLQDEMNHAFGSAVQSSEDNSSSVTAQWVPAIDVHEYPDRFVIVADLPGVEPDAIEITMDAGILTLSGDRKSDGTDEAASSARRRERIFGSFYRRFTLPDTVDGQRVEASSSHGVLQITVPKKEQVQPKKITVNH